MEFITKALNTEDVKLGEQISSFSPETQNHKITLSSPWHILIQHSFSSTNTSAKDEDSHHFQNL